MKKSPSPDLAAAIVSAREEMPPDLTSIRAAAEEARGLELEIEDLEQRLKDRKSRRHELIRQELPEMMDSVGLTELKLAASGNLPALRLKLYTEYKASIPESWPEDKRRAAFDYLDGTGAGDLISTEIKVDFTRSQRHAALVLKKQLQQDDYEVDMVENVHWKTLTAWLKEQVESSDAVVPLDVVGGFVARTVRVEREEE